MLHDDHTRAPTSNDLIRSSGTAFRVARWLAMSALVAAVFAMLASHAPPRIKLLGLFAIVYGLLVGGIAGMLGRLNGIHNSNVIAACTFLLIAGGLAGMSLDVAHRRAAEIRRNSAADPKTALILRALEQDAANAAAGHGDSGASFRQAAVQRQRMLDDQTRFAAYLKQRVSPLGNWPVAAAELFWAGEIVAGSWAGAWAAQRVLRSGSV